MAVAGIDADHSETPRGDRRAAIETGPDVIGSRRRRASSTIVITIAGLIKEERPGHPDRPWRTSYIASARRSSDTPGRLRVFGEGEASFLEPPRLHRGGKGHPRMSPASPTRRRDAPRQSGGSTSPTSTACPCPCGPFRLHRLSRFLIHGEDPYIILIHLPRMPYRLHILRLQDHLGKEGPVLQPGVRRSGARRPRRAGDNNFTFVDDTFTLNKRRLKAICQGIIERDIRATSCAPRGRHIDTKQPTSLRGRAAG